MFRCTENTYHKRRHLYIHRVAVQACKEGRELTAGEEPSEVVGDASSQATAGPVAEVHRVTEVRQHHMAEAHRKKELRSARSG